MTDNGGQKSKVWKRRHQKQMKESNKKKAKEIQQREDIKEK